MGYVMTYFNGRFSSKNREKLQNELLSRFPTATLTVQEDDSVVVEGYTEEWNLWEQGGAELVLNAFIGEYDDLVFSFDLSEEYSVGGGIEEISVVYSDRRMKIKKRDFLDRQSIVDSEYRAWLNRMEYDESVLSEEEYNRCSANGIPLWSDPNDDNEVFPEDGIPKKYFTYKTIEY